MRPAPPIVIRGALKALEELAAGRTDEQEISRILGLMAVLSMLEDEWDVCASSRMTGIVRYSDIVRRGSVLVDRTRHERLDRALATVEAAPIDLRISSLETKLDLLREAITDLQSWLEDSRDPAALALLAEVWQAEYEDARADARNGLFW
jgi:hypothetical protein